MGYTLVAIIGKEAICGLTALESVPVQVVHLKQGVCMIPLTARVYDAFHREDAERTKKVYLDFWLCTTALSEVLTALSHQGVIAYVEADYSGGHGTQAAIAWHNGHIVHGPLQERGTINKALCCMEVVVGEHFDEFEAVGLQRYRETAAWLGEEDDFDE